MSVYVLHALVMIQSVMVIGLSLLLFVSDRGKPWRWLKLLYMPGALLAILLATIRFRQHFDVAEFFLFLMAFQVPYVANLITSFFSHRVNGGVLTSWKEIINALKEKVPRYR